jgi:hypothetical protein
LQLSLLTLFLVNINVNALVTSSMAVYPMVTIMLIKYGECNTDKRHQYAGNPFGYIMVPFKSTATACNMTASLMSV